MARQGCWFTVTFVYLGALGVLSQNPIEERTIFEAAFQGRCGHGSPCEQLCYELHDGMYECDCTNGYVLDKNGYSCSELNSTSAPSNELSQLINDIEKDELNTEVDNEEDAVEDILYMRGASFTIHLEPSSLNSTPIASNKSRDSNEIPWSDQSTVDPVSQTVSLEGKREMPVTKSNTMNTETPCSLDCGAAGNCYLEQGKNDYGQNCQDDNCPVDGVKEDHGGSSGLRQRCQCPLGRSGDRCELETDVKSPRFTGSGWLAFPALRAAYKHVQLDLEFRPEAWDGILLLAGERDDLQGDFMALILHQGFIEFRFDCGSGVGVVRSTETVKLNKWNTLSVYRHRWDAWIQLNQAKRVQGRSKGLFSRITFREPLFVGGPGNTSGLERLPVGSGFRGCVRHLEANEHHYRFPLAPQGDAANGFDVEECTADRCSKVPCSHGGKCLATGGDTAVCLCPLGYTGDLCETRVDLQVPSFNGSSYLRYPGLSETSLSWLELAVTLKPMSPDGVILYNGHHSDATGDFIALYLSAGHVQFTFDLGTGPATLRSESPVRLGEWVEVRVSRTGRLAALQVEDELPQEVLAPGAFTQLSLPLNLYLGGGPTPDMYTPKMKTTASFVGCIQTVLLNNREVGILAEALGGVNVGNCGHPCEARPCGDAECRPLRERFTCRCHPGMPHPCPAVVGSEDHLLPLRRQQQQEEDQQHQQQQEHLQEQEQEQQQQHQQQQEQQQRHIDPSISFATGITTVTTTSFGNPEQGFNSVYHRRIPIRYQSKVGVPSFTGSDSYLHYNDADTMKRIISYRVDINMRFRASSSTGLLLWSGRHADPSEQPETNDDFLALGLNEGYLTLAYNLGSGEAILRYNVTRLDDDLWHRVRAVRNEQWASLVVDSGIGVSASSPGQLRQLNTDTGLYVGGAPDIVRTTGRRYFRGMVGCISDLVLDTDFSVALSSPEQSTNTHSCIP